MNKQRSETKPPKASPLVNTLTEREITDKDLESLKTLVDLQLAFESDIAVLEKNLEQLKEKHQKVSTQLIPDAMKEIGLSEVTTSNGARVVIKPFYSARIPDEWITRAFKWLRAHDHGGLIKNVVVCEFGKGADNEAKEVKALLKKEGIPFEHKETIHPQTLKSFVKEQIENGKPLNHDMFGVYVGAVTKIEIPS